MTDFQGAARRTRRSTKRTPTYHEAPASASASAISDEEDVVVIDVDKIRKARTEFYSKSSDQGMESIGAEGRHQGGAEERSHRKRRSNKSSATVNVKDGVSSSHHRRRRRRSKAKDSIDETEYVYNRPITDSEEDAQVSPRPRRRLSPSPDERRESLRPKRVEVLRNLGLQPPMRTVSEKTIRRSRDDTERRRHSYQEGTVMRTPTRTPADTFMRPRVRPKRSISLREPSRPSQRPGLVRSQTTVRKARKVTPPMPPVTEDAVKSQAGTRLARSNSVFGTIFGPQKPTTPEARVTCLTCMADDIPKSKSARLACSHRMCFPCLKRLFMMSVKDPAHMPPKCCSQEIDLKHVDKLFDRDFKVRWNRRYEEFKTKNRVYCPTRGCGNWIPPRIMQVDAATKRRFGKCIRCKTKVCAGCNRKWHGSQPCHSDEDVTRLQEMAEQQGWKRCYNCSAMVELKEGCNHMTCRCKAEFCMICGAKWKSCDCPWFNYGAVETDRLEHMNIAEVRREPWVANQPLAYHEELEQRREQERTDEELARRMQDIDIDLNIGAGRFRRNLDRENDGNGSRIFAVGNAPRNLMNADFVNRATNILTAPYGPASRADASVLVDEIRGSQRIRNRSPMGNSNTASGPQQGLRRSATTPRRPIGVVPGAGREAERLIPRRTPVDYDSEAEVFQPAPVAAFEDSPDEDEAPAATLAGLQRRTTTGRVDAWRRHVTG